MHGLSSGWLGGKGLSTIPSWVGGSRRGSLQNQRGNPWGYQESHMGVMFRASRSRIRSPFGSSIASTPTVSPFILAV
jgi:hypothetical protein